LSALISNVFAKSWAFSLQGPTANKTQFLHSIISQGKTLDIHIFLAAKAFTQS